MEIHNLYLFPIVYFTTSPSSLHYIAWTSRNVNENRIRN